MGISQTRARCSSTFRNVYFNGPQIKLNPEACYEMDAPTTVLAHASVHALSLSLSLSRARALGRAIPDKAQRETEEMSRGESI